MKPNGFSGLNLLRKFRNKIADPGGWDRAIFNRQIQEFDGMG